MPAPATLELEEVPTEVALSDVPQKWYKSPTDFDENGRFAKGKMGGPGRPKGSKSYAKALSKASNKLAQAYIKAALKGNATLLVDSRKVFVPIDGDAGTQPAVGPMIVFNMPAALPTTTGSVPALSAIPSQAIESHK